MVTEADRSRPEAVELRQKLAALELRRFGPGDHHRELFAAYDGDHDGACNARELRALLSDAGVGNALTRGLWVGGLLEHLDRDRSESVTYSEFEGAIGSGTPAPSNPSPPAARPAPAQAQTSPRTQVVVVPARGGGAGALVALGIVALVVVAIRKRAR